MANQPAKNKVPMEKTKRAVAGKGSSFEGSMSEILTGPHS